MLEKDSKLSEDVPRASGEIVDPVQSTAQDHTTENQTNHFPVTAVNPAPQSPSVRSSLTTFSYDSFKSARDDQSDSQSIASQGSAAAARYPGAHTFVRQLSLFIAREDRSNELFVRERPEVYTFLILSLPTLAD